MKRQLENAKAITKGSKKQKISENGVKCGHVLTLGQGDTGQLGLGPDVMERVKPGKVNIEPDVIQVVAGGMHTVCLNKKGEVYTFGCNDDAALGRVTNDEEESEAPAKVALPDPVQCVSAGDSHTAALTRDGQVYVWGSFRDSNGAIGICPGTKMSHVPMKVELSDKVKKIASGNDHLCCLTERGELYTMGNSEQGQLGRVAECFSVRGGRKGLKYILEPQKVHFRRKKIRVSDIWTGQYGTYVKDTDDKIHSWGLNNYYQMGFNDMVNRFVPEVVKCCDPKKQWKQISGGQHHALLLDNTGHVYAIGRHDYGRLGLGENNADVQDKPVQVPGMENVTSINAGTAVSFCVNKKGEVYGWGMGSSQQLAQREEDDVWEPTKMEGKQLENRSVLMIAAGGQHTVMLASDNNNNE